MKFISFSRCLKKKKDTFKSDSNLTFCEYPKLGKWKEDQKPQLYCQFEVSLCYIRPLSQKCT